MTQDEHTSIPTDEILARPLASSVTLQDVADRCGVGKSTVRRALLLNGRNVRPDTAERIRRAAVEMGYDPHAHFSARSLGYRRQGKEIINRTIVLVFPVTGLRDPYFLSLYQGVFETITSADFDLTTTAISNTKQLRLPNNLLRGDVDGILLFSDDQALPALLQQLRAQRGFGTRPVVSYMTPTRACSSVTADDVAGGYALVSHLLALGHRYLLHFASSSIIGTNRVAGYRAAYQEQGLDPEHFLVLATTRARDEARERTLDALETALQHHPEVTAILAPNDFTTPWIWEYLHTRNIRVPGDISLVGFDDTFPILNERQENILTTMHVPLEEIGCQAATLLLHHILGKVTKVTHRVLPVHLVARQTTAPPRATRLLHW